MGKLVNQNASCQLIWLGDDSLFTVPQLIELSEKLSDHGIHLIRWGLKTDQTDRTDRTGGTVAGEGCVSFVSGIGVPK